MQMEINTGEAGLWRFEQVKLNAMHATNSGLTWPFPSPLHVFEKILCDKQWIKLHYHNRLMFKIKQIERKKPRE